MQSRIRKLTRAQRIAKAEAAHKANRIIQNAWRKRKLGREYVCALGAFGEDINSTYECPADLMPHWLAELIPSIDDSIPEEEVPRFMDGLLERVKQWDRLSHKQWFQLHRQAYELRRDMDLHFASPARWVTFKDRLFAMIDRELSTVRPVITEADRWDMYVKSPEPTPQITTTESGKKPTLAESAFNLLKPNTSAKRKQHTT